MWFCVFYWTAELFSAVSSFDEIVAPLNLPSLCSVLRAVLALANQRRGGVMGSTTTVFAVALPVAVYIWVTSGSYWFARLWCDFDTIIPSTVNPTSDAQNLRVLLVSDPHILGSKRSSMDQQWTNWHIGLAYDHSVQYSNPDIVFGLGDLLDEGRRSMLSKPGWEKYSEEGLKAFHLRSDKGRTSSEAPPFLG